MIAMGLSKGDLILRLPAERVYFSRYSWISRRKKKMGEESVEVRR
jgi:hypothetical protein